MKPQEIFIVHPKTHEQEFALKAFMKALKIKFQISTIQDGYNPEFVKKILDSKKQAKNGQVTRVNKENLKEFLGI